MPELGHPKNQHYVPQFILRNFSLDGGTQIYCFDKRTQHLFKTNVRNVASEKWFYDLVEGEPEASLEGPLSDLETQCSRIINDQLLVSKSVRSLSVADLENLALFIAVQMLRTTNIRETAKYIDEMMEQELGKEIFEPGRVHGLSKVETDTQAKEFAIGMIQMAGEFLPHLLDKVWILYESKNQFFISDNPVGLYNTVNQSRIVGTLGLAVRGIEVYFPLSPQFTLGLLCRETFNEFAGYFDQNRKRLDDLGRFEYRNFVNAVRRKLPVACIPDTVLFMNSVQVSYAERFLFSNRDDFSLAIEMTKHHPNMRRGPRPSLG